MNVNLRVKYSFFDSAGSRKSLLNKLYWVKHNFVFWHQICRKDLIKLYWQASFYFKQISYLFSPTYDILHTKHQAWKKLFSIWEHTVTIKKYLRVFLPRVWNSPKFFVRISILHSFTRYIIWLIWLLNVFLPNFDFLRTNLAQISW